MNMFYDLGKPVEEKVAHHLISVPLPFIEFVVPFCCVTGHVNR